MTTFNIQNGVVTAEKEKPAETTVTIPSIYPTTPPENIRIQKKELYKPNFSPPKYGEEQVRFVRGIKYFYWRDEWRPW